MALTYQAIATVTVGSGGASNIEFTSIPGTYTDLLVKVSARQDAAGTNGQFQMRFNGSSSTIYSRRKIYGDGSSALSNSGSSEDAFQYIDVPRTGATANTFGNVEIYIPNYAGSNNKSISIDAVTEQNGTTAYAEFYAGLWASTSAITSITLIPMGASEKFLQYSTATLYGIKNTV